MNKKNIKWREKKIRLLNVFTTFIFHLEPRLETNKSKIENEKNRTIHTSCEWCGGKIRETIT